MLALDFQKVTFLSGGWRMISSEASIAGIRECKISKISGNMFEKYTRRSSKYTIIKKNQSDFLIFLIFQNDF